MKQLFSSIFRYAGWLAAGLCAIATLGFAVMVDGYSHARHPPALLGAKAIPHAFAYNLLAFVVPGLLVVWIALRLRERLPAGWSARIGAQLMLLSALAFVAQGLLPLDLEDLDGAASSRHAAVWMLWWIAFGAGGALLALGLRRLQPWTSFAATTLLAAAMVPMFALFVSQLLPAGFAQRIAFAIWFAWAIGAGYVTRSAASASGSSPTASR